jgi:protein O-mannosyl-transferase
VAALFIAIITFFVFLPALNNGFVNWDDDNYVYRNTAIQHLDSRLFTWVFQFHSSNWHPLTWLSHALDYALWGATPTGHHAGNIILHSLNSFLLCLLIMYLIRFASPAESLSGPGYLTKTIIAGCVTALLFGIHPLRVESVAWIAERKDVLSAFFMLLALIFYVNYAGKQANGRNPLLYSASLLSFVFALMSKPVVVTLPLILLILDMYPFRRFVSEKRTILLEKIPFFFLSLLVTVLTVMAQHSGGAVKPFTLSQIGVVLQTPVFYLVKIVWPVGLSPVYPYPKDFSYLSLTFIGAFILLIVITELCIRAWKKEKPVFIAAWVFFIVTLLPVMGIVRIGTQAAADRYTYMPSIAPCLLIGLGVAMLVGKPSTTKSIQNMLVSILVIISCILGILTIRQISVWKNSITLWTSVLKHYPGYNEGYINRANAYMMAGHYKEAVNDLNTLVQMSPKYTQAYNNRGLAFGRIGNYQLALIDFSTIISLDPASGTAYNNRAKIYFQVGDYKKGMQDLNKAIELSPETAGFYSNRCEVNNALSDHEQAIKDCSRAIELDPNDEQAYLIKGLSLYASGKRAEAIAAYDKALKINPYNPKVFFSRGIVYKENGEFRKALDDFNNVVKLNPRYPDAYINRGVVYGEMNDLQKAVEDFTRAVRINPKDASAYYNRGAALYRMDKKEQAMQDFRQAAKLGDKAIQKILRDRGIKW